MHMPLQEDGGRHPNQMPERPQLGPLVTDDQKFYSELLTLSIMLSPATRQRKLIPSACIRSLVLSVFTQSL